MLTSDYEAEILFGPRPLAWDTYKQTACPSYEFLVGSLGYEHATFLHGIVRGQCGEYMGGPKADELMAAIESLIRLKYAGDVFSGEDMREANVVILERDGVYEIAKNRYGGRGPSTREHVYSTIMPDGMLAARVHLLDGAGFKRLLPAPGKVRLELEDFVRAAHIPATTISTA